MTTAPRLTSPMLAFLAPPLPLRALVTSTRPAKTARGPELSLARRPGPGQRTSRQPSRLAHPAGPG